MCSIMTFFCYIRVDSILLVNSLQQEFIRPEWIVMQLWNGRKLFKNTVNKPDDRGTCSLHNVVLTTVSVWTCWLWELPRAALRGRCSTPRPGSGWAARASATRTHRGTRARSPGQTADILSPTTTSRCSPSDCRKCLGFLLQTAPLLWSEWNPAAYWWGWRSHGRVDTIVDSGNWR